MVVLAVLFKIFVVVVIFPIIFNTVFEDKEETNSCPREDSTPPEPE